MDQLWVVAWQSKSSGASGRDERAMTRDECLAECSKLNEQYPRWHHWPAKADDKPRVVKKKTLEPIPDKKPKPKPKAAPKPKPAKLSPGDATALVSKLLKGII